MITIAVIVGSLLIAAIVFIFIMQFASDASAKDFDGGFHHENLTRITRVRGTYIINDDGEKK